MTKVTFVIQDLFSLGAQYVTALIIRGFIAKGYDVDLIVSQIHNDKREEGLEPFYVPPSVKWKFLPYRRARNNIFALAKYLRNTSTSAVVSMSSNYAVALSIAKRLSFSNVKIYNVEHNGGIGYSVDGKKILAAPIVFSVDWWINQFVYRPFERILTVSEGNANAIARMLGYPKNKIDVVYNPVVDNLFYEKLAKRNDVHTWLKEKNVPVFVSAGAHVTIKNHMLLLKAFKKVNEVTKVKLVLFGRGELTEKYKEYIYENNLGDVICVAGYTNNLPVNLAHSDGLIVSSNLESFSVVMVEALACGVTVISTDCPYGPREILKNGKYGTLVPLDDVDAMADAILDRIRNGASMVFSGSWSDYELDKIVMLYEESLGLTNR